MTSRRVVIGLAIAGALLVAAGIGIIISAGDGDDDDAPQATLPSGFGSVAVSIETASGGSRSTCMLEARTTAEHARGLMEVTDPGLGGHDGMVFVYDEDTTGGFWMRNTPMALSIAYLDDGGRIVSSIDMAPCGDSPDCPVYPAGGPYRYAIEVPRGDLERLGLVGTARAQVGGDCP